MLYTAFIVDVLLLYYMQCRDNCSLSSIQLITYMYVQACMNYLQCTTIKSSLCTY